MNVVQVFPDLIRMLKQHTHTLYIVVHVHIHDTVIHTHIVYTSHSFSVCVFLLQLAHTLNFCFMLTKQNSNLLTGYTCYLVMVSVVICGAGYLHKNLFL